MIAARRALARPLSLALIAALAISILPGSAVRPALAASPDVVISQAYGGGGNAGATLTHDFVELFNRGASPVSLSGWSIQYASATGTGNFGATTTQITELPSVTVQPGQYYLVQEATGGAVGAALPTPDLTDATPIAMAAGAGKVAVASTAVSLGCNGSSTVCSTAQAANIVDLVGYGSATYFEGTAAAPTASATLSVRRVSSCVDTDQNGTDFGAVTPAPRNTATTLAPCGDAAPSVTESSPTHGATNVATNVALSVTFSESVTIDTGALTLVCGGEDQAATVSGDPGTTFEITYLPPLPDGASCTIAISAAGVHDTDTNDPPDGLAAAVAIDFTVVAADPCAGAYTPIPEIQGSGPTLATPGTVTTEGVVIGDYEGPSSPAVTLRGYYIQDPVGDGNPATSDAIFVFNGANATAVSLGDSVRVTGTALDFQDQTQISQSAVVVCGTGATVAPTTVSFPVASVAALEAYEGMLVRVSQVMTVTEHFQLGRFGQVVISSDGRLDTPTAVVAPGAAAIALQAENDRRKVIVDDASQGQNPDPIIFGRGGLPLSASNTLRGGDTISGLTGVLTYTWAGSSASGNAYRIRPVQAMGGTAQFDAANARPGNTVDIPGENVRIAGLNLLNYFNTYDGLPDTVDNCSLGAGGAPADCRGADTLAEFDRQWPKTVAAILGIDADVIGVNEIENDGYGPTSAIAHLVDRLNDATAPGTYAFIDVDAATGQVNAAGTDAIKVGLLYRPAAVTPIGTTGSLDSVAFVNGGDSAARSRPSLAQAFETLDGARFIVDVNHLKSKGSACNTPDAGDGQGNCNLVRTNAAIALRDWLATDPTGTGDADVFIVGDLNSYAMEDPVTVLTTAGYTNLVAAFVPGTPYSYVFDGQWGYLDHALGSASAATQVAGVIEWHINSDEPSVLDYNTNFKTAGLQASLYAPDRFRVSDHDPIVVGLDAMSDRPTVSAGGPYTVRELGSTTLTATGSDPTGDALTYAWDLDGDSTFETPGRVVQFSAGTLQAPQTVTVTVQVTDEHGQQSTASATIDVIWDFAGFQAPSNPTGVTEIKAGSSLPIKFSLTGDQGLLVLDGPPTFQRTDCTTGAEIGGPVDAAAGELFSYDNGSDTYKFVWKTPKAWSGRCGTLTVSLADGQGYDLAIRLKP